MTSHSTAPARPFVDPTSVMDAHRGIYHTRLLVAAAHHLDLFEHFENGPQTLQQLQQKTGLAERSSHVLIPAMCASGFIRRDASTGLFSLTDIGLTLTRATQPNLLGYLEFSAQEPGTVELAERLRHDGPLEKSGGVDYVKDGDGPSPMDDPETARLLTMRLEGRARILSARVADALPHGKKHLLDIAGGSGYFAYAWLLANPEGTATVLDRPAVLRVAEECLEAFCKEKGVDHAAIRARVNLLAGDMVVDELPKADIVLAFSLFHDWGSAMCETLAIRFAGALNPGGTLWVHDEFLDDTLDGPLYAALYGAQLFWITKGRTYSRAEHHAWFTAAGLKPLDVEIPTALHYGLIAAGKGS